MKNYYDILEVSPKASKEVIEKAYDDWWTVPNAEFEPIGDWVSDKLKENGIEFEIYFKLEEEEESD